ncbi:hypothetical protein Tco_0090929 [Tanacetum coccineum]
MSSSSSSSSHTTVMYTSVSSDDDLPSWCIPLMDAYEPEAPLLPVYALVYPEYLAPSDDDITPAEDQPLPAPASPTALSLDYSADSESAEEDPKEDPKEEPSEEEKKELSALADSPPTGLYIDLPSKVEEDEVPSTPPSPTSHHHIILLSQTRLRRARMLFQPQTPLPSSIDAIIEEIPSPPLLLPPPTRKDIILEADMPLRKRDRFAAPSQRFEIGESLAAAAARQPGHRQDIEEFYVRHQDTQDDRVVLRAHESTLERERRYHLTMAIAAEQEAT